MSCDDDFDGAPDHVLEAVFEAASFLYSLSDAPGTRITSLDGAIFILRDPDHIERFEKLYFELLDKKTEKASLLLRAQAGDNLEN